MIHTKQFKTPAAQYKKPSNKMPRCCNCGCGDLTKGGQFIEGHRIKPRGKK